MLGKDIKLEEAVARSQSMIETSYLWTTYENIFDLKIPKGNVFDNISILWGDHNAYIMAAEMRSLNGQGLSVIEVDENNSWFTTLKELRKTYPKLFEVTGEFRSFNSNEFLV